MSHEHHHHKTDSQLTFDEKLKTLFTHWIGHNDDHAKNYKDWSDKIREEGKDNIAELLIQAAEMTDQINEKFKQALDLINK